MSGQKVSSRSNIPLAWWKGYLQPLEMLDPRRPAKKKQLGYSQLQQGFNSGGKQEWSCTVAPPTSRLSIKASRCLSNTSPGKRCPAALAHIKIWRRNKQPETQNKDIHTNEHSTIIQQSFNNHLIDSTINNYQQHCRHLHPLPAAIPGRITGVSGQGRKGRKAAMHIAPAQFYTSETLI